MIVIVIIRNLKFYLLYFWYFDIIIKIFKLKINIVKIFVKDCCWILVLIFLGFRLNIYIVCLLF